jgi:hypothetical protein
MMCCALHNICILTIDDIEDFLAQDGDVDGVLNNEQVVQIHVNEWVKINQYKVYDKL